MPWQWAALARSGGGWRASVLEPVRAEHAATEAAVWGRGGGELGRLRWLGKRRYLRAIPDVPVPGRGSFQSVTARSVAGLTTSAC